MRRKRISNEKPRERRTLVPSFDPVTLAQQIENEVNCETSRPPFNPSEFAREAEAFDSEAATETERHVLPALDVPASVVIRVDFASHTSRERDHDAEATPPSRIPRRGMSLDDTSPPDTATEEIGREMYSSYLASDFPEALVLAERVLDREPAHALAQLVADRCRDRMKPAQQTLSPSSVVRLRFAELERQSKHIDARTSYVLGHVDGMTDAMTVATLSGLPPPEALDRLHALLDLGVIEVVA